MATSSPATKKSKAGSRPTSGRKSLVSSNNNSPAKTGRVVPVDSGFDPYARKISVSKILDHDEAKRAQKRAQYQRHSQPENKVSNISSNNNQNQKAPRKASLGIPTHAVGLKDKPMSKNVSFLTDATPSLEKSKSAKLNSKKSSSSTSKPKRKTRLRKKNVYIQRFLGFLGITGPVSLNSKYAKDAAEVLDLQPHHLRRLRSRFDQIDVDGSGNISVDEFLESMNAIRSPFTDKLFALIDLDGNGTIEFDEYVRVLATYCMFSKDEILRFCFECYDADKSGAIDEKEFIDLCKTVNNAMPSFPANFRRALEDFDVNEDGLIDYTEFCLLERRYPLILYPAFKFQDDLQKYSLGEREWVKILENYNHKKTVAAYKLQHGGKPPPEKTLTSILKSIFPCLYTNKLKVDLKDNDGEEDKFDFDG